MPGRIDGEIVILMIGVVCFGLGIVRFALDTVIFDQTLPITNLVQIPITPKVKSGETFRYIARFDKRMGCKVTQGGYSISGQADNGDVITLQNFSTTTTGTWAPGPNKTAVSGVGIPKSIPSGRYTLWWRYCWRCQGARGILCIPTEEPYSTAMPVIVVN